MKLTIQKLDSLSAQDLIDLAKIWPEHSPAEWQSWLSGNRALFAAKFNERLLAAVKVSLTGESAELQDLLVREVTRRRGVGLYLVEDTLAQMPEITHWTMKAEADPVLDAFMLACKFHKTADGWEWNR
ncbi:MAG: aspartate 1-decarboxylase autocleavage activator PanM [Ewingella sp.]|jgi:GNAT superfamily N-acetyltransferase|uniref:aspartate 1-decarboxylase autocleavage activator PanM n=1 Tax=Ewingella TaxID=41201 RepID=UPI0017EE5E7B|nr:aspartate 1-decarboxylase autocleavage activator PanM [Pseudomonas reactans]